MYNTVYDVVIPAAPKDYIKLPYCVNSLRLLNPQPQSIFIVSKDRLKIPNTIHINEDDVLPIDVSEIPHKRPQWVYQQLIKLYQKFTLNDYYLCVDSDIVFNRKLDLFNRDNFFIGHERPIHFISSVKQKHPPYMEFIKYLFASCPWIIQNYEGSPSFICDFMMMSKNVSLKPTLPEILRCIDMIPTIGGEISEYEIMGSLMSYAADRKNLNVAMYGKYMPDLYDTREIVDIINTNKNKDIDVISMHSWT